MSQCSQSLGHASTISVVTEDFQGRENLFFLSKGKKENISLNGSLSNNGIDREGTMSCCAVVPAVFARISLRWQCTLGFIFRTSSRQQ